MKTLKVTWKGISPLIMHSCQGVNPLHPITREIKKLNDRPRGYKMTEEELIQMSNLEWESGCYWQDEIGVYVPSENIEATIRIERYVSVTDLMVPLDYGENLSKEQLINDSRYRDTRPMVVSRARVFRTRPRFNQWKIIFNLAYNEEKIDVDVIKDAMEFAGDFVGLCDSRPKYGKFVPIIEELD